MTRQRVVHKYAGDDPTATLTACGLWLRTVWLDGLVTRLPVVDADARRVTCGNCARVGRAWCVCGAVRIYGSTMELAGTKHRLDGPCYCCDEYGDEVTP